MGGFPPNFIGGLIEAEGALHKVARSLIFPPNFIGGLIEAGNWVARIERATDFPPNFIGGLIEARRPGVVLTHAHPLSAELHRRPH